MNILLKDISNCMVCKDHLPLGPRPIVAAHPKSKIVIIGQAPGTALGFEGGFLLNCISQVFCNNQFNKKLK